MFARDIVAEKATVALLDAIGEPHRLGHQSVYAARYLLRTASGNTAETMFERGEKSPPNLWLAESRVKRLIGGEIKHRRSPASVLNIRNSVTGEKVYGRHSALEKMDELGAADLICFAPAGLEEIGRILDEIMS